jgi:hypothetical protein
MLIIRIARADNPWPSQLQAGKKTGCTTFEKVIILAFGREKDDYFFLLLLTIEMTRVTTPIRTRFD